MKKLIFILPTALALALALAISTAQAGFILKIPLEVGQGGSLPTGTVQFKSPIQLPHAPGIPAENWQPTDPEYSAWVDIGAVTSCTNWSPATSTVTVGQSFNQIATDCQQDQERTKQEREIEQVSLEIRNSGTLITESQTIAATSTRTATGIKETWVATTPTYTDWVNSGDVTSCTNWSPATSTVTVGQSFPQTATDCIQNQSRTKQDREQETTTLATRNVGASVTEAQSLPASSTRTSTGTKAAKECFYDFLGKGGYWMERPDNTVYFVWDGKANESLVKTLNGHPTSYTQDGYTYSRGTLKDSIIITYYYSICRE